MNKPCGTLKCIVCGKPAKMYAGHLKAKQQMALGNLAETEVLAGFCSEECYKSMTSDNRGCFGNYKKEYGYIPNIYRSK